MNRLFLIAGLFVLLLPAATVQAQDAPRPRTLVRAWLTSQTERGRDLGRIALHEEAQWTLDGPFGVRRIGWTARVSGQPGLDNWQREVITMRQDGRRVLRGRWQRLEQQWRSMTDRNAQTASRAVIRLHQLLARMEPIAETIPERVHDVSAWRVELIPRNDQIPIERATLWFDREQGHLVRSRLLIRSRGVAQPFLITTEYRRVQGFDVPHRRVMEGTSQMKRRLRTYTVLFKYQATYRDYRFFHNEGP